MSIYERSLVNLVNGIIFRTLCEHIRICCAYAGAHVTTLVKHSNVSNGYVELSSPKRYKVIILDEQMNERCAAQSCNVCMYVVTYMNT